MIKAHKSIKFGNKDVPLFTSRFFSLVLYLEKETVKYICDDEPHILNYIFIQHDKDVEIINDCDDTIPKEKHIHLIINTDIPYKSTTIWNKFRVDDQNVMIVKPQDLTRDVQYLLHLNENDTKYKYDYSELIFNNNFFDKYFKRKLTFIYDDYALCCIDVSRGATKKELLQRYGGLYVKNYTNIMLIGSELKYDILNDDIY